MENMKNQWICLFSAMAILWGLVKVDCYYTSQMPRGFSLSPAGKDQFQLILLSPSGDFALGFYMIEKDRFLLSVAFVLEKDQTKVNATEIVWSANENNTLGKKSKFMQDGGGSVALVNERGSVVWDVVAAAAAEVVLLDSGNLQVKTQAAVQWQSFDHPTDTLLEAQNMTAGMRLVAAGGDYWLQMETAGMALTWRSGPQVYWRRKAMQEKALIDPQKGPIYARLESDGYIAMYQSETQLVDVTPLDTYHQKIRVSRRLKLDPDGNLRAYYWNDGKRSWDVDFQAVESPCKLPSTCGPYAICGLDGRCGCMSAGGGAGCMKKGADFCSQNTSFVRISGLDLPYSEFAAFVDVESEEGCMDLCGGTCGCAAALFYSNSKRCYQVMDTMPTLVQESGQDKVAFVKYLNTSDNNHERSSRCRSGKCKAVLILGGLGVVVGGLAAVGACVVSFWRCKLREGKREVYIAMSEKFMAALPYKNIDKDEAIHGRLG